jgi:hypothetical protein
MALSRHHLKWTIGSRIYAVIGFAALGLLGLAIFDTTGLGTSLKQQKQVELKHLAELALSIVKQEQATQASALPRPRRRSAPRADSPRCATATTTTSSSPTSTAAW